MTSLRPRFRTALTALIAVAALSACGGAPDAVDANTATVQPTDAETIGIHDDEIVSFKFEGLTCDAFLGYEGGGIDCDFDSFTKPAHWKPGVIAQTEVSGDEVGLTYYEDGHYCVTFSGYKSGGLTCSYPHAK